MEVGEWQGGKHQGGIFREGRTFVLDVEGDRFRFPPGDYESEADAMAAVIRRRAELSLARNLTKNRYRYVTDPISRDVWLEVELNHGQKLICDVDALPLVEKEKWFAGRSGKTWYVECTTGAFHTLLTGYSMTDHRDRNGLNNRASNLRETTPALNMRNLRLNCRNVSGRAGVLYDKATHAYVARLGSAANVRFAIDEYGNEGAWEKACATRAQWEKDNNVDSEIGVTTTPKEPLDKRGTYKCPECGRNYRYHNYLKLHVRTQHTE
jgi:hypothetical protein